MAQSKKTTKGKKTSKSNKKTTSKKTATTKKTISNSSFNAVSALVIMGLITIIIMLVNSIYFGKNKEINFIGKNVEIVKAQDLIANRNGVEEKKSVPNKNTKVENEISKNNNKIENKQEDKVSNRNQSKRKIKLYFVKLNNKSEKIYLSSVRRNVNSDSSLKDTLNKLIKGPSLMEKKKGLLTAIPSGLKIKNIRVRNRTAEINFNEVIEKSGNGDILIKRIDQIVYTATQFNNIDSVLFKINGKRKKTLGSDGLSISGPIHRRR